MRATSFRRTVAPSLLARSTMLPNCSTLASWPLTPTPGRRWISGTTLREA